LLEREHLARNLPQHHAEIPLFLEHTDAEARRLAKRNAKSAPPRSRTAWMCSSDVMLRINSSAVSGVSAGPSTRCNVPCTRMVGAVATRICKSEAPSDTTSCNKSDIAYDMTKSPIPFRS